MSTRHLLLSNPPHGDIDVVDVASHFGLTEAGVRMKANYGLPEIWFAEEDRTRLLDIAAALDAGGLNTVVVAGSDLVDSPPQSPVESFAFMDDGLWVQGEDAGWTMAYDVPSIAVFSRPHVPGEGAKSTAGTVAAQLSSSRRMEVRRRTPGGDATQSGAAPFLDIYTPSDSGPGRTSFVQNVTDFSLLPADPSQGLVTMENLVAECERQFEDTYFDRRMVGMRVRGSTRVVTQLGQTRRTGYSYGTTALTDLLGSLSPDFGDLSQADLSSRLVYLTKRALFS